jgi:1-phosphofructokinase
MLKYLHYRERKIFMLTIVSLNPCIDWQYNIAAFNRGGMNRVHMTYESAASKGTNVAVVLKNLEHAPCCIGFNFVRGGEKVTEKFDSLCIPHDFETVEGAVRINIKLFEESTGIMTELNQPGGFVPEIHVKNLETKVAELARQNHRGILVLGGSLPAGVPKNFYAKLTSLWQGKVFLDAEGDALRLALDAEIKPFAVKPNLYELENAFDVKLSTIEEIVSFCRERIIFKGESFREEENFRGGVRLICVSMGADGAVLVTKNDAYFCPAVKVNVRGLQGAGDSMVAGLIHGILNNKNDAELLRYAVAAAKA